MNRHSRDKPIRHGLTQTSICNEANMYTTTTFLTCESADRMNRHRLQKLITHGLTQASSDIEPNTSITPAFLQNNTEHSLQIPFILHFSYIVSLPLSSVTVLPPLSRRFDEQTQASCRTTFSPRGACPRSKSAGAAVDVSLCTDVAEYCLYYCVNTFI